MTNDRDGLLRENDIIGNRKQGTVGLFPVSRSTWRKMVREGKAPVPIKLGHMTFWKRSEVLDMIERIARDGR